MNFPAQKWARTVKTGSYSRKAVLRALADHADHNGVCWPSQKTIAAETELTVRTVRTALGQLEELGFLVRESQFDEAHRRQIDKIILAIHRKEFPLACDDVPNDSRDSGSRPVPDPSITEHPSGTEEERPAAMNGFPFLAATGSGSGPKPAERVSAGNGESQRKEFPLVMAKASGNSFQKPAEGVSAELLSTELRKKESSLHSPKKGHRLPEGWKPDDGLLPFAFSEGLSEAEFNRALDEFRDYWHSLSGQKATKLDWDKTFRNRLREVADRRKRSNIYDRSQRQRSQVQEFFAKRRRDCGT